MILKFAPGDGQLMQLACLWSHWTGPGDELLSFAIVTDEPPPDTTEFFISRNCAWRSCRRDEEPRTFTGSLPKHHGKRCHRDSENNGQEYAGTKAVPVQRYY